MYLDKFQKIAKHVCREFENIFKEMDHNEKMYIEIINTLKLKIINLHNILNESDAKQVEIKNIYEEKMMFLIEINNNLLTTSLNLQNQLEHMENENLFSKIKKHFGDLYYKR